MKKLSLLVILLFSFFIHLSAQIDKKDTLIVINGIISNTNLRTLDPNTIDSISVLKDQAAVDEYGILGENGVKLIFTKDRVKIDSQKDEPSKPLVLVDGKVYINSLDSINIQEIESFDVRKGISATKHYGKAGENGVFLITTKGNPQFKK
jgi:hypothetical protein